MNANKGILYSAIAHAIIIILMVFKVVFYPEEAFDLSAAIRVDMVDLPEKMDVNALPEKVVETLKETVEPEKPKEPEPTPEPEKPKEVEKSKEVKKPEPEVKKLPDKKEKVDNEAVNIDKAKTKQQAALAKLKTAAALEKLKQDVANQKKNEKVAAAKEQVVKGTALSAGTALTGLNKLQSDSYLVQVDQKIKSHWALPQWLIGKPLRARIHIQIDPNGTISTKKLVQTSGNPDYDEYCMQTIDKASPLPPVPEKFTNIYKINGVVIGFPD